ncbi:MAG: hypothetical protein JXQ93_13315 [Flavobacteriaceae bacterium]
MSVKFIEYPQEITIQSYEELKVKLVNKLLLEDAVLSVYQMGSVKEPGISDLDLICVFRNESTCNLNVRVDLSNHEKNILTHGVFGIEERFLFKSMSYNLLSNLKLLGGEDFSLEEVKKETSEELKTQIALEYMLKMYITLEAQKTLKVVKLRSFLLLAKAILFDLELIGIQEGKLYDLVQQVFKYRAVWYDKTPSEKEIKVLVLNFHLAIEDILKKMFEERSFYLPYEKIDLLGNFKIEKSLCFETKRKGTILPSSFKFLGKKFINLQYRLNTFTFYIPFNLPEKETEIYDRFEFNKNLVGIGRERFPYFIPITSSLSIY